MANGSMDNGVGNGTAAKGAAAKGAAKPAGGVPPPPADVAAAVDATLAPNPALAEELQQVGGGCLLHIPATPEGGLHVVAPTTCKRLGRSQQRAARCHRSPAAPAAASTAAQVFDGGRHGLLERLFPNLLHVNAVMTGQYSEAIAALPGRCAAGWLCPHLCLPCNTAGLAPACCAMLVPPLSTCPPASYPHAHAFHSPHAFHLPIFPPCVSAAGSMSKYVPHLRALLPTVPFLSAAYGATEGMLGVQADLVEYWAAHDAAAKEQQAAQEQAAAGGSPSSAAEGGAAANGSAAAPAAAPAGFPSYADFPREPDGENSYVLLPDTGGWSLGGGGRGGRGGEQGEVQGVADGRCVCGSRPRFPQHLKRRQQARFQHNRLFRLIGLNADCYMEFIPYEHTDEASPPTVRCAFGSPAPGSGRQGAGWTLQQPAPPPTVPFGAQFDSARAPAIPYLQPGAAGGWGAVRGGPLRHAGPVQVRRAVLRLHDSLPWLLPGPWMRPHGTAASTNPRCRPAGTAWATSCAASAASAGRPRRVLALLLLSCGRCMGQLSNAAHMVTTGASPAPLPPHQPPVPPLRATPAGGCRGALRPGSEPGGREAARGDGGGRGGGSSRRGAAARRAGPARVGRPRGDARGGQRGRLRGALLLLLGACWGRGGAGHRHAGRLGRRAGRSAAAPGALVCSRPRRPGVGRGAEAGGAGGL